MLAEERQNRIVEAVSKSKIVKVVDLSKMLGATEATVRRDLDELQNQKRVRRVHGGATTFRSTSKEFSNDQLQILCMEEKKAIARRAYEFIDDNDAVILDASTTALELAKLIAEGERRDISVITNSFSVISALAGRQRARVVHTGGQLMSNMNCSVGAVAEHMLRNLKVDKCFLGTNGIDPAYGYSVPTFEDASTKKCMLLAAKQRFVLADHTKFGESYMGKFAEFRGEIDYLVTDQQASAIDLEVFESSVTLVLAP